MSNTNEKALTKENLRQAQKVMLYIMKRIHAVCVKHNIKYWLDYGTLLGAIRHDGFIPWDDDMDICMMRDDYEKFSKIAQDELGDEFFWQTQKTDRNFWQEMGKVRLNGTLWQERSWAKASLTHTGLFVDIFPQDPLPENPRERRKADMKFQLYTGLLYYKINKITSPRLSRRFIQYVLSCFYSCNQLFKLRQNLLDKLSSYKDKSALVSTVSMFTARNLCDKALFDDVVLKKFEDAEFYIPARYEERLHGLFNDYMKLPPEDQRYGHHGIVKIDFGKYNSI